MPQITITIDEQQEAKIIDLIDDRCHFMIVGGTVKDTDGKDVFLNTITFEFMADDFYSSKVSSLSHRNPPVVIERGGDLRSRNET